MIDTSHKLVIINTRIKTLKKKISKYLTLMSAGVNIKRRITVAGIETLASSRPPEPCNKNHIITRDASQIRKLSLKMNVKTSNGVHQNKRKPQIIKKNLYISNN